MCCTLPPVHVQAWGLMELQRGNWLAAVMLLERSARLDVACQPVLKWHVVQTAKKTVGSRKSRAGSGSVRQQQEQQRSQRAAYMPRVSCGSGTVSYPVLLTAYTSETSAHYNYCSCHDSSFRYQEWLCGTDNNIR